MVHIPPLFPVIGPRLPQGLETTDAGVDLYDAWVGLAYQKPPEDIFGKIFWFAGVLSQLVISLFTFPAALGAFLLEESVQTAGMGAYMLSTARDYESLDLYLDTYKTLIEGAEYGATDLALINPITGGAVIIYMEAAKMSHAAFRQMTDIQLLRQAETDEKLRQKLLDDLTYGVLRISSSPGLAEIWIDGVNTELLTSETFKRMEAGPYVITLMKYSVTREVMESYTLEIEVVAGKKKEIYIRIPKDITSDEETPGQGDDTDTPQLPSFIKAEVTGDYALDGDTFQTTTGERIRILGIDTPELGRPYADLAKEYTASLIEDKKIQLTIQTSIPVDTFVRYFEYGGL